MTFIQLFLPACTLSRAISDSNPEMNQCEQKWVILEGISSSDLLL